MVENNNTINIVISDETNGNRFSTGVAVEGNSIKAITEPMTCQGGGAGVGGRIAKSVGMKLTNQMTGGVAGMMLRAATPVGIAMLALSVATKAYTEWRESQKKERERANILFRAGGEYRSGAVNQYNLRTHFITGKISGANSVYGRR